MLAYKIKNKLNFYRIVCAVFLGLFVSIFYYFNYFAKSEPLLANYYLRWDIPTNEVENLAKWDLVILDMENQVTNPDKIRRIRQLNPNIKILAYVTSQEIKDNNLGVMRAKLKSGISDSWYLRRGNGDKISFWPGTTMLNPTDLCPLSGGQRWNQYLAGFVNREVLSTGLWDGVFYDNAWGDLTWFTGNNVDLNFDGQIDFDINKHWNTGMTDLFNLTRDFFSSNYIIVGNAMTREYANNLNGMMYENFQNHIWRDVMYAIKTEMAGNIKPRIIIINANANNTGNRQDYRTMRYGLGSALIGGAYYSFDDGDKSHSQTWWYDEYNVKLGQPLSEAQSMDGRNQIKEDVWRRDYQNGLALVNSTDNSQTINLGDDYEKIIGQQDRDVNNGEITESVTLPARDGLIMLKTAQTLRNVNFKNGNFVRFFSATGARARNGFFAFENGAPGGATVFVGDLDGDKTNEKVVASNGRLQIFNNAGQIWFDNYHFNGNYQADIRLAVGKPSVDNKILVTPAVGAEAILYTYYGRVLKDEFYPFGKKYRYGFYGALGYFGGNGPQMVIGSGGGLPGVVQIYDTSAKNIQFKFYPFSNQFLGRVRVAVGNFHHSKQAEIATIAKIGNRYVVRIFDVRGKKLSEFFVSVPLGGGDLSLAAVDINFDGIDEVVIGN